MYPFLLPTYSLTYLLTHRSDVLIHYPFQDDHSHVSDIIKMDKAEKSSLKKSLKYQLPTSNFIKMSELGRSKVITQVFNEMKGNHSHSYLTLTSYLLTQYSWCTWTHGY